MQQNRKGGENDEEKALLNLKGKIVKNGITQKRMGELLEIPVRTIQNWENGVNIAPIYVEKLIIEKLNRLVNGEE